MDTIKNLHELREKLKPLAVTIMTTDKLIEDLVLIKDRYKGEEPVWVEAFLNDAIEGAIPVSFFLKKLEEVIIVVDAYKG